MRSLLSSSKLLFTTTKGFLGTTKQIGQWGRSYSLMPGVIEHSCRGETAYDINGPIIDDTAGVVVGRLHFFECDNPSKPEPFYMYPPGGAVPAGLAINDTMEYIRFINKTCLGQAASMGSLIPVEDTNGERRSSKCNDHDSSQFGSRKARAISAQP
ncbi:hypothetical protein L6164_001183 [Bauhinia variegata]|uniref:Uncharacterized protein n=1 Tax=Bauhinia variegata TaxID=167791 RepID=A0ACB9Q8P0_BAUVA|nr:hypothetical protein L6164_001183 [Bauhinia variegata]